MDILNSIPVLSETNPVKPVSLEDIQRIHSSLTLENPLTFMIFLSKRPDLAESEKGIYLQIIERLKANEKFKYESTMAYMVSSHLPVTIPEVGGEAPLQPPSQPVTDIGGNVVYDA
jgi:hypothetical protein